MANFNSFSYNFCQVFRFVSFKSLLVNIPKGFAPNRSIFSTTLQKILILQWKQRVIIVIYIDVGGLDLGW